MNYSSKYLLFLLRAALIAAVYVVLTLALAPFSYGEIQVRVSEALNVLPFFTAAAIPGLTIGCLIANLFSGYGLVDVVFGTMATLIAAILARLLRRFKYLVPLPAVVVNAIVIGLMLQWVAGIPFLFGLISVGIGQIIACYGLGLPLLLLLEKYKHILFRE